jgi:hypothetical protein
VAIAGAVGARTGPDGAWLIARGVAGSVTVRGIAVGSVIVRATATSGAVRGSGIAGSDGSGLAPERPAGSGLPSGPPTLPEASSWEPTASEVTRARREAASPADVRRRRSTSGYNSVSGLHRRPMTTRNRRDTLDRGMVLDLPSTGLNGPRSGSALPRAVLAVFVLATLTGCPTVDLGDNPPDPGVCRPDRGYFDSTIWPQYLAPADEAKSCVRGGCHGDVRGVSALRLDSTEPIDLARNYSVATRFLNCGTPEASLLYTKPLRGLEAHGGGDIFGDVDAQAAAFRMWFP